MSDIGDRPTISKRAERLIEVLDFLSAGIFVESMVTIAVHEEDDLGQLETRLNSFATEFIRATVESDRRLETIVAQKEAIARLSSPMLAIWEGVLLVPIIGILDERRAVALLSELLEAIVRMRVRVVIVDLTGVNALGTEPVVTLHRMIQAAKLMGCQTVLCGISSSIAQILAQSGSDIGNARIAGRLKDALELAIKDEFSTKPGRAR